MNALQLPPAEFRALAGEISGIAAEFLQGLDSRPSFPEVSAMQLAHALEKPLPEEGMGHAALDALREVLAFSRPPSPRFFGYVHGSGEPELMAPVELSAVCFRHRYPEAGRDADAFNAAVLKRISARGRVYLSNATLNGHFALRACFVNHRTTDADVAQVVPEVLAVGREVLSGS